MLKNLILVISSIFAVVAAVEIRRDDKVFLGNLKKSKCSENSNRKSIFK